MESKDLKPNGMQKRVLPEVSFATSPEMDAKRQIRVIAASGKPDRSGDIVVTSGIQLEEFAKNPIILWAHDHYGLPVAKAVEFGVVKGKLEMVLEFATAEVYSFADTVYKLIKGGFLKGVSIGAQVLEAEWMLDKETEEIIGRKFTSLNLLELSVVPIPADSKALVMAFGAKAITENELTECLEKSFETAIDFATDKPVHIDTVRSEPDEETQKMDEIKKLDARITALEALITASQTKASEAHESLTKVVNDLVSKFGVTVEPNGDMQKTLLGLVDQMVHKLSSR